MQRSLRGLPSSLNPTIPGTGARERGAGRRGSGKQIFLAAVLVAALAAPADAFELKIWPLLDLSTAATGTRLSLLGPLVEWTRTPDETTFAVRPLFATRHRRATDETRGIGLYPVAWWESSPESFFLRFFGLVSYESRSERAAPSPWTRQFTIFPFVFYRESPERGRFLTLLPVYADLPDSFGFRRIRSVLFPLFVHVDAGTYTRSWLPFPFVSWAGGETGSGFRVWPLWADMEIGHTSETRYVLWPFWIRSREHLGHEEEQTTRVSWPLFALREKPGLRTRIWGFLLLFPIYTHTVDDEAGTEAWGFPWPLWVLERELATGETRSVRILPFYQDRRTALMRSRFWMWPLFRHREGIGDGYERTDVLFTLYRDQREGFGRRAHRYHVIFPLWFSKTEPRRATAQAPTLYEGLFPKNRNLEVLYAPLYRIYHEERYGESTRRSVLWNLVEWGDGNLRPPWYLSFR